VLPSLNVPVTENCSVVCFAMVSLSGLTAMETRLASVTVKVAVAVLDRKLAVMVVVP
jgi:hypothetical protein